MPFFKKPGIWSLVIFAVSVVFQAYHKASFTKPRFLLLMSLRFPSHSFCARGPLWAWRPGSSTELPVLSSAGSWLTLTGRSFCTRHVGPHSCPGRHQPHYHPPSHQEPREGKEVGRCPAGAASKDPPARGPKCSHTPNSSPRGTSSLPSFNKHALSSYCVPSPALGAEDGSASGQEESTTKRM